MKSQRFNKISLTSSIVMLGLLGGLYGCGGSDDNDNLAGATYGTTTTATASTTTTTAIIATSYALTSLVSDGAVPAAHTDVNLKNGWGLAFNPIAYGWVANQGTSTSTLYDGNGVPQPLVVSIPAGQAGPASPTGIVYNPTLDFQVTQSGLTGRSEFIFVGEAGTVSGWSPTVNMTAAITTFDGGGLNKRYKGLAISSYANANYLYAADFHNKAVDVFNGTFQNVSLPGNFVDPALPAGYAPYGIQAIGTQIYVSYAQQDAQAEDELKGSGLGIISVFDTAGNFVKRLVTGGVLNAPWGMALAPTNFGQFSNTLLVSNFGDGTINAFDPTTGALVGTLSTANGTKIVIDGLWGIAFGNGINNQPINTLFFAAGPASETQGQYGRIDAQ